MCVADCRRARLFDDFGAGDGWKRIALTFLNCKCVLGMCKSKGKCTELEETAHWAEQLRLDFACDARVADMAPRRTDSARMFVSLWVVSTVSKRKQKEARLGV